MISDTHLPRGGRRLPEGCVRRIARSDLVVHAGDFVAEEAFEEVAALGPPLVAVHGNVDSPALKRLLPETRILDAGGASIAVVHDAGPARGRCARLRRRFPDADAVIFGHSHAPLHEESEAFQIFNPGSPTERRRSPHRAMGLAEVRDGRVAFAHVRLD